MAKARRGFDLTSNTESIITGTVVSAAVIASAVGLGATTLQLCIAIVGTVLMYWLSHVHAVTVGLAVSEQIPLSSALRRGIGHSWPLVYTSLLPLGILLIAELLGAEIATAATIALVTSIALLAIYGYLAGSRGGLGTKGAIFSALGGLLIGVLTLLIKAFH